MGSAAISDGQSDKLIYAAKCRRGTKMTEDLRGALNPLAEVPIDRWRDVPLPMTQVKW